MRQQTEADRRVGPYVVISPCRDEAHYMRRTLNSVIAQSVRPAKWIIVDDGSKDATPTILEDYRSRHAWIEVVTRRDRGHRAVGPGVVDAFYAGYDRIDAREYEFICKLDLDLELPSRYFETLLTKMAADPRLGTCSGKTYVQENDINRLEIHGDENSIGASKFYRTTCFFEIGGFVRQVMWDGIDCHRCRMLGWTTASWDEAELRILHLRPEGTSQKSVFSGRFRHGYGQYFMGTSLFYVLVSAVYRIGTPPYFIGSAAIVFGWIDSWLRRKPRYDDPEFRKFLRRFQWHAIWYGKARALMMHRSKTKPRLPTPESLGRQGLLSSTALSRTADDPGV